MEAIFVRTENERTTKSAPWSKERKKVSQCEKSAGLSFWKKSKTRRLRSTTNGFGPGTEIKLVSWTFIFKFRYADDDTGSSWVCLKGKSVFSLLLLERSSTYGSL